MGIRLCKKHLGLLAVICGLMAGIALPVQLTLAQVTPASASAFQLAQPPVEPGASMETITLQDALARAKKYDAQFLSAVTDSRMAREDVSQARAALLPQATGTVQYLGTQGNGTLPSGRFVSNDGIHLYRAWGVFQQDLSPSTFLRTGVKQASAAEAIAKARAEIAARGLAVTVTSDYYALAVSQRKYATAQQALQQAQRFLEITQLSEKAGQTAHSDTVKAELQFEQRRQSLDEAQLVMQTDRLNLAILVSPALNVNFTIVDDLDTPSSLPPFAEARQMAEKDNPELHVAFESLRQGDLDVSAAKLAFLPTLNIETDYGIEANSFALRSHVAADPEAGRLPNLGYFVTATLNVPVWDWGALRSKLRQAKIKQEQAQAELSLAQRQMVSNLYAFYNQTNLARSAVESTRHSADLATESLRLINLRYQAGESNALEVVDAQNSLVDARNAYDDAQARYRLAVANLQTLTGAF